MELHISLGQGRTLVDDVYRQLKDAVLEGRLRPADPLPSTRELARRLAVARNTVAAAFDRLIAEGFLYTKVGAGTFVARIAPPTKRRLPRPATLQPRSVWARVVREVPRSTEGADFDFRIGAPDPTLFPWDEWRSLVSHHLRGRHPPAGYPPPEGDPKLREAIAHHVGLSRAVKTTAEDVLVCSGAQQAFDLIARVLVEPGNCVAVEDPGYPSFRRAVTAMGAHVVPVRVDDEGLVVDELPNEARLVYVTPSHQFPLGMRMSLSRRVALLEWSARHGAAVLEDDYDSEFRFDGRPLEPLQSLDRCDRVLYVGTFSKVLLPTLRLGFVVAPPTLTPALRAAKELTDSHGPLALQRALADLLSEGAFARHVRRLLRLYRPRRDALLRVVEEKLGESVTVVPSVAGLHMTVLSRAAEVDAEAWAERARARHVAVQALGSYYQRRPRAGLALGFGLIAPERIPAGIARLAACAPTRGRHPRR